MHSISYFLFRYALLLLFGLFVASLSAAAQAPCRKSTVLGLPIVPRTGDTPFTDAARTYEFIGQTIQTITPNDFALGDNSAVARALSKLEFLTSADSADRFDDPAPLQSKWGKIVNKANNKYLTVFAKTNDYLYAIGPSYNSTGTTPTYQFLYFTPPSAKLGKDFRRRTREAMLVKGIVVFSFGRLCFRESTEVSVAQRDTLLIALKMLRQAADPKIDDENLPSNDTPSEAQPQSGEIIEEGSTAFRSLTTLGVNGLNPVSITNKKKDYKSDIGVVANVFIEACCRILYQRDDLFERCKQLN